MKRIIGILLLGLLCCQNAQGQVGERPINIPQLGYSAEICFDPIFLKDLVDIKAFIVSKNDFLEDGRHQLTLTDTKKSLLGTHYIFQHSVNGITVYNSTVRICMSNKNKLVAATFNLIPVSANLFPKAPSGSLIFYHHGLTALANRITFIKNTGHFEAFISLTGDTLWLQDRKLHLYVDTVVKAKVYLPNPLQSAKVSYGIPYVDSNDADVQVIREELKDVTMPARYDTDTFYLANSLYSIGEVSSPFTIPAFSKNNTFYFNRSQSMFEDVNSFYHITRQSEYIKKMGFNNLLEPIVIDAHANLGDNSAFDPFAKPFTLEFGIGGVDDAEDGQVVIHEFSHSLSHAASPFTVNGSQRESMEEGNADYFTVSYSRQFNDFNWIHIFSWDGHNEFYNGFSAKSNKRFPDNIVNNTNEDREIWTTTLMCIYEQLGKAITDSLVLTHLYLQAPNTTMPQMARALLKVDTMIWNADHAGLIMNCFDERGILAFGNSIGETNNEELFNIYNSSAFASGEASMQIKTNSEDVFSASVYSVSGQLIQSFEDVKNSLYISPEFFSSGVYILVLNQDGRHYHYKFSKW